MKNNNNHNNSKTIQSQGFAAKKAESKLEHHQFTRREPNSREILIEILYCGVCHSDIHNVNNDWGKTNYPIVPGHEIVGKVIKTGSKVKKFSLGDFSGVGCIINSCRKCNSCQNEEEQYCIDEPIWTYNSILKDGTITYGGYSNNIVVNEDYALKISPKVDLASTAPLLCAGITTYSPMKRLNIKSGKKVGIVGLGGLGHMALKFGRHFGAYVVQFTSSPNKTKDALALGANEVIRINDKNQMDSQKESFDCIIDTVSAAHDINNLLLMLKHNGYLIMVGLPSSPLEINSRILTRKRINFSGSLIGGIKETQEMLDFCAKHKITADIEIIPIQKINEAYERMEKSDVKYRFVIDMKSLGD